MPRSPRRRRSRKRSSRKRSSRRRYRAAADPKLCDSWTCNPSKTLGNEILECTLKGTNTVKHLKDIDPQLASIEKLIPMAEIQLARTTAQQNHLDNLREHIKQLLFFVNTSYSAESSVTSSYSPYSPVSHTSDYSTPEKKKAKPDVTDIEHLFDTIKKVGKWLEVANSDEIAQKFKNAIDAQTNSGYDELLTTPQMEEMLWNEIQNVGSAE